MNKLSIRKFKFIGIIVASVFLFFVIAPTAFAVSESRYYRSDMHTVNGLNASKLGTTNSASETYIAVGQSGTSDTGGCPYLGFPVYYNSDIYIRHSNGAQTLLGSSIAQTVRGGGIAEGYQSNTWSCPKTSLSPTDAIRVIENVGIRSYSKSTGNFITEQLDSVMLEATTWTFNRYTWHFAFCENPNPIDYGPTGRGFFNGVGGRTYYGSSSYNTRISNFAYTPAQTYVDCGLRIRTGTLTLAIACEPAGTLTSPLRIRKGGSTYGIVLVATTDANASPLRIQTSSGVKALRKY